MKITLKTLFTFLFIISIHCCFSQIAPKFNNRKTICFIGNSITQDGRYHMLLQTYFATRHPNIHLKYINCGISGDVADGMLERFESDILIHKPNYAFLMVGMNDVQQYLYNPDLKITDNLLKKRQKALENYYIKTEKLANLIIKNGIIPIFLTPSIYDQTAKIDCTNNIGVNDALEKCSIHIRKLAKKHDALLVDLQPEMLRFNKLVQKKNPSKTIISQDRVHPGDTGHFIMMHTILNSIETPNKISEIKINAKKRKLISVKNSAVTVVPDSNNLTFMVNNNSLPFPLTKNYKEAERLLDFTKNYNQEILKITQLKKGTYQLTIDKIKIGSFTSKQLRHGINLSNYTNTPQSIQAKDIAVLCKRYHKINGDLRIIGLIDYKNLKDYNGTNNLESKKSYLKNLVAKQKGKSWYNYMIKTTNRYFEVVEKKDDLCKQLEEIRFKIYAMNTPKTHRYKLLVINESP